MTGASVAAFLVGSKGAALFARTRCFTIRRGGGGLRCGALKLLFTIRARGVALLALWPPDFNHFRRGLGGGGVRDCFSGRRKFGCGLFNGWFGDWFGSTCRRRGFFRWGLLGSWFVKIGQGICHDGVL